MLSFKIPQSFKFFSNLTSKLEEKFLLKYKPSNSIHLNRKNVYIFPNAQGVLAGCYTVFLLIGAMVYQLSLGYILGFTVGSIFFLSIFISFYNFYDIHLRLNVTQSCFVNQNQFIEVNFTNRIPAGTLGYFKSSNKKVKLCEKTNKISITHNKRGLFTIGSFVMESTFPFGIIRTWTTIKHDLEIIFYPKPMLLPSNYLHEILSSDNTMNAGSIDFHGIRTYQPGDDPRKILWSRVSSSEKILLKEFKDHSINRKIIIDYLRMPSEDHEEKISQMTWLIQWCEKSDYDYQIKIFDKISKMQRGSDHFHSCLKELALIDE